MMGCSSNTTTQMRKYLDFDAPGGSQGQVFFGVDDQVARFLRHVDASGPRAGGLHTGSRVHSAAVCRRVCVRVGEGGGA